MPEQAAEKRTIALQAEQHGAIDCRGQLIDALLACRRMRDQLGHHRVVPGRDLGIRPQSVIAADARGG